VGGVQVIQQESGVQEHRVKEIMAAIIFQIIRHLQTVAAAVELGLLVVMQQLLLRVMAGMERLQQLAGHLLLMLVAAVAVVMAQELQVLEVQEAVAMRMVVQVRQILAAVAQEP
jgi:hypothetical protein